MAKEALRDRLSVPAVLAVGSAVTMVAVLLVWLGAGSIPLTSTLPWILLAAMPGGFLTGWTAQTATIKLVGGPFSGFLGAFLGFLSIVAITVVTSTVILEIIPLAVLIGAVLLGTAAAAGGLVGAVLGSVATQMQSASRV